METPDTRRQAGALIHTARRKAKLSQRALAKRAAISETWLRSLTTGLRGQDPQRAADETWIALAEAVHLDPRVVFAELGRPWPDDEEGEDATSPQDKRPDVERTTHQGRLLEIVADLEADTDDLPAGVAEEIIRRSVEAMAAQARMVAELERRRWERQRGDDPKFMY